MTNNLINHLPANNRDYTNNPITEQEMRSTYIAAFGKEYDSPERKQFPLPIEIAYLVAVRVLQTGQTREGTKGGFHTSNNTNKLIKPCKLQVI